MKYYGMDVSIFDIMSLGRQTFSKINDAWFRAYLSDRIITSFEEDEQILQQEKFYEEFGKDVDFDKFMGKVMGKAYAMKMSSYRDSSPSPFVDATPDTINAPSIEAWRDWEKLDGYEAYQDSERTTPLEETKNIGWTI
ncbi:hypothetical protein BJX64DRAFT_267377 [Aspergillus heterothallicus]